MPAKRAGNEAVAIAFGDAAEFATWLDAHPGLRAGVWLKIAKKASGVPSLTSDEPVDVGLCYGWISRHRMACDRASTCGSTCRAGPRIGLETGRDPARPCAGTPLLAGGPGGSGRPMRAGPEVVTDVTGPLLNPPSDLP